MSRRASGSQSAPGYWTGPEHTPSSSDPALGAARCRARRRGRGPLEFLTWELSLFDLEPLRAFTAAISRRWSQAGPQPTGNGLLVSPACWTPPAAAPASRNPQAGLGDRNHVRLAVHPHVVGSSRWWGVDRWAAATDNSMRCQPLPPPSGRWPTSNQGMHCTGNQGMHCPS